MSNLKHILDSKKLILVDGSIKAGSNLCWKMYDTCRYHHLDADEIIEATLNAAELEEILLHENTYTINSVTEEIKEFERILGDKLVNLTQGIKLKSSKERAKRKQKGEKGRQALSELQERIYSIRRLAQSSEIDKFPEFKDISNFENSRFDYLLRMVKLVAKEANLKKDYSFAMGEHKADNSQESDTDERLATTIYQLCLAGKTPCLLAQDSDFIRLLRAGTNLICSDSFFPYNKELRDKLVEHPFEFYYRDLESEEYDLEIQSHKLRHRDYFKIKGIYPGRSKAVGGRVKYFWREFEKASISICNKEPVRSRP
jgi:hypothetical protein